jgi:hypothetical protein
MNKRLHELANQAGFSKDKYGLFWDEDANAEGVDLEKFAELMVEEFQTILRNNRGEDTGTLSYRVEEHFRS